MLWQQVKYRRSQSLPLLVALLLCFHAPATGMCADTERADCERIVGPLAQRYYPSLALLKVDDLEKDLRSFWSERYHGQSPGCVGEDFDGDGLSDFAMLLKGEKDGRQLLDLVVLLQAAGGEYRPVSLDVLKDRLTGFFIRAVPPRTLTSWEDRKLPNAKSMPMEHVGFELVLYEAAARVYYWKNGAFVSVQTAE